MTNHRKQFFTLFALLLPLLGVATSCMKEDTVACQTSIRFTVKAYDADRATELTPATVSDVMLYVFDRNNLFVQQIATSLGTTVDIAAPADDQFSVIALGNSGGGKQTRPVFRVGDHISTASVALKTATRATAYLSPDDLFLGSLTVLRENFFPLTDRIIPIYRKTGSMTISVRGMKQYFGFADNNYSVVVNSVNQAFSLQGQHTAGDVVYSPTGAFNAAGDFVVPLFNLLASSNITLDIYHGTQLLTTITSADALNLISVTEGLTTQVRLNYLGEISVTIDVKDWGSEIVDKEYN